MSVLAALSQHQDLALDGAAATNKAITLALAQQSTVFFPHPPTSHRTHFHSVSVAAAGGDPQDTLTSGTFAPGQIGDRAGAGNSCDDADDPVGCFSPKTYLSSWVPWSKKR